MQKGKKILMTRLIEVDEIKKREHDVTLGNGAKHRCFDTTCLDEIPTVEAIPIQWIKDYARSMEEKRLSGTADNIYSMLREWRMSHGLYKGNR